MSNLSIKIIRQADLVPTLWKGGKTTQLAIFPENSSYANRDFTFRISTATVETETSTFTPLAGVKRSLMVLKGSMRLEHKGHYAKEMNPFDVDNFLGDWETVSYGKVTDFNLMTQGNTNGYLGHKRLQTHEIFEENNQQIFSAIAYYVAEGSITLECQEKNYQLHKEELILLQSSDKMPKISIKARENTDLIGVFIG